MNIFRYFFSGTVSAAFCLAFLVACGDEGSNPSSSNSGEKGTPIAKVDTSLLRKYVSGGGGSSCGDLQEALAKRTVLADLDDESFARPDCGGSYRDIFFYINSRIRVVDSKGMPAVGAMVYEGRCAYDDENCQYVTDSEGYIYIDSVNFVTYWEKSEGAVERLGPKNAFSHTYERLQLRAISADTSYGANIFADFARANIVEIDGEQVAELQPIKLEPVYTTKLYLDSIHVLESEGAEEFIEEVGFGVCVDVKHASDKWLYAEEIIPSYFYPCQKVTEEDQENGYVMVYGLPEDVYWISIGNADGYMSMGRDSLVVTRPK